ncbi:MAG: class I tRNA ligase family protein, partial [Desulfomonilaceae bacterium]
NIRRVTHKTIKKITEDIGNRFHFNTAIAAIMEMSNELAKFSLGDISTDGDVRAAIKEAVDSLVLLMAPFVPHIAEELWETLGYKNGLTRQTWPDYDPELLTEDTFNIVTQVNGKKRAEIHVSVIASEDEIKQAAIAEPNVQRFIEGHVIRKIVVVPGKLVNIVVG